VGGLITGQWTAVRKKARTFRVAGAEVKEGEEKTDGKGKGQVDLGKVTP
jgi:hypothetical protein